jgi:hypothetical protein
LKTRGLIAAIIGSVLFTATCGAAIPSGARIPEVRFVWTPLSHDPIVLSPELSALLARDPIQDRSPIKALDHLLGSVFTDSPLLDWAHNLKGAVVNATDPGRSIVKGITGQRVPKGYTSRADWLASLKTRDLAAKGQGLFTSRSLLVGLSGAIPKGVSVVGNSNQPDFLALLQAHRAWIAKNDPGFYAWQAQVEKQVQQETNAENHKGGALGIIGLIVAAVVAVVATVVTWGAFSGAAAAMFGTVTTAAGTTTLSAAATVAFGVMEGATVGFLSSFTGTLIASGGDFGAALKSGLIGLTIGIVTAGLLKLPLDFAPPLRTPDEVIIDEGNASFCVSIHLTHGHRLIASSCCVNPSSSSYSGAKRLRHLHRTIDVAAQIWNHAVALKNRYYKLFGKGLPKARLQAHVAGLRNTRLPHWSAVGSQSVQAITDRLYLAWEAFFRGDIKRPPRFRARR